ncbi:hypothetical protein [Streptomyces sp. AMCC400023]|uniref:hypothetical protein n=1 Tax=Streptomyces sp. AMCC400023 TaxID=2056258 RepID=UPI001F1B66E6|nr:hypothetical protein [Streptomyces sp. AMCC400023]UJV42980.1 hypothetical protein CVT30_26850 [Streptomyces sp. AMCC400023]
MNTIRVQPAARRRREFAVWATAQSPKVRTVAPNTFAVPADLFLDLPDELLTGSLIDGTRYVSPAEDAALGTPPPPTTAWTPPVLPEREAVPGEPLPELPPEAYGPDSVPLDFAPLDDAPADDGQEPGEDSDRSDPAADTADLPYPCEDCGRPFATGRGLATHRGLKHPEGA